MTSHGPAGPSPAAASLPGGEPPSVLESAAAALQPSRPARPIDVSLSGALSRYALCARLLLDERDSVLQRRPEEVSSAVAACKAGAWVLKFGRSGKPHRRFLRATDDGEAVYYVSARKKLADATVPFADVERIQTGQHTSVFGRQGRTFAHLAPRSLSVVCSGGHTSASASSSSAGAAVRRTLDLVFDTQEELQTWCVGLLAPAAGVAPHSTSRSPRPPPLTFPLSKTSPQAPRPPGAPDPYPRQRRGL
jgi:hypothetical protein